MRLSIYHSLIFFLKSVNKSLKNYFIAKKAKLLLAQSLIVLSVSLKVSTLGTKLRISSVTRQPITFFLEEKKNSFFYNDKISI